MKLKAGDKVFVLRDHPWGGNSGTLIAFEKYGLGWNGWRVELDNGASCYANTSQLQKV